MATTTCDDSMTSSGTPTATRDRRPDRGAAGELRDGTRREDGLERREGRALGSPLRLTVRSGQGPVDDAWAAVQEVFGQVDRAMSRFRDDSELTLLARHAPAPMLGVSRTLVRALCAADRARRVTDGRFEPRIVTALEGIGYVAAPQGTIPNSRPSATRGRVLVRDHRYGSIGLTEPIDLGGIGKGLALRWAADALAGVLAPAGETPGRPSYLLDAGGDIVLDGVPTTGEPWHVGIENPSGGTTPVATVKSTGRLAIATSSTRRLRWTHAGQAVHHLIDPRTGKPGGAGLLAVTVAGPDPAWAEVWSKALFLEGRTGIAALARSRGLAAWWVTADGDLEMTAAARVRTTWVAAET